MLNDVCSMVGVVSLEDDEVKTSAIGEVDGPADCCRNSEGTGGTGGVKAWNSEEGELAPASVFFTKRGQQGT